MEKNAIDNKNVEIAILEIAKLQVFLQETALYRSDNKWQFRRQCNIVYNCLNSLTTDKCLNSLTTDNCIETSDSKTYDTEKQINDSDLYYYDVHSNDKDKRTRSILRLIDNIHIDMLKTIINIKHSFDFLSKEEKISLSKEIIDGISESFNTRIKNYTNKLKKMEMSKEQIKEFDSKSEKYLLHIIDIYIKLYKKENENMQSISLQNTKNKDVKRIRNSIKKIKNKQELPIKHLECS